jgi:hypothetical protein
MTNMMPGMLPVVTCPGAEEAAVGSSSDGSQTRNMTVITHTVLSLVQPLPSKMPFLSQIVVPLQHPTRPTRRSANTQPIHSPIHPWAVTKLYCTTTAPPLLAVQSSVDRIGRHSNYGSIFSSWASRRLIARLPNNHCIKFSTTPPRLLAQRQTFI